MLHPVVTSASATKEVRVNWRHDFWPKRTSRRRKMVVSVIALTIDYLKTRLDSSSNLLEDSCLIFRLLLFNSVNHFIHAVLFNRAAFARQDVWFAHCGWHQPTTLFLGRCQDFAFNTICLNVRGNRRSAITGDR
ncbi:hypothetical protein [Burkholderia pseudomallei]|nr:hypothetical protein [Burkholderia pseudomallei]